MSDIARCMLTLLTEWQRLPRAMRDESQGLLVMAAETHFRAQADMHASYEAWIDLVCDASPLPIPFCPRGEA